MSYLRPTQKRVQSAPMTKTKIKRRDLFALYTAVSICRGLSFQGATKFRYAIKRNMDFIQPEIDATREAFPPADGTPEEMTARETAFNAHMDTEVECPIYQVPF